MRILVLAVALMLMGIGSASADVTFCNKTSSKLQFGLAYPITVPYETKEVSGWYTIDAGDCKTLLKGNYANDQIYYYITYYDGSRSWTTRGDTKVFSFCVQGNAFTRRGTYHQLQNDCPAGWVSRDFFGVIIQSSDDTLNFFD